MSRFKLAPMALVASVAMALLLTACGGSPEAMEVEEYMNLAGPLIEEATALNSTIVGWLSIVSKSGPGPMVIVLNEIDNDYKSIVARLTALDTPPRGAALTGHTTDGLDYMRESIDHMARAVASREMSYTFIAKDAHTWSTRSLTLAADELNRLAAFVDEERGTNIGTVFLGILGFGIAASVAIFLLCTVRSTGCFSIEGILSRVQAVSEKLKRR